MAIFNSAAVSIDNAAADVETTSLSFETVPLGAHLALRAGHLASAGAVMNALAEIADQLDERSQELSNRAMSVTRIAQLSLGSEFLSEQPEALTATTLAMKDAGELVEQARDLMISAKQLRARSVDLVHAVRIQRDLVIEPLTHHLDQPWTRPWLTEVGAIFAA